MFLLRATANRHVDLKFLGCACYSRRVRTSRRAVDPGVHHQIKIFNDKSMDAEEIEELENDFSALGMAHKHHEREITSMKEKEKLQIVYQKYFKKNMPNFLTWNDREQIKFLHRTNPEEWTVEKLSESFPALPDVISKIIKGNWTRKNAEATQKHDAAVSRNWDQFKKGKFHDLPTTLTEHLKKFTNRQPNHLLTKEFAGNDKKQIVFHRKPLKTTEFSDIITSYERLNEHVIKEQTDAQLAKEEAVTQKKKSVFSRPVTLPHLQRKLERDASMGKNIDEGDKLMLKEISNKKDDSDVVELNSLQREMAIIEKKHQPSQIQVSKTPKQDYSFLEYPLKIRIPDKVRKKGGLYKLNDCYYNGDGYFLYRVPGMVG